MTKGKNMKYPYTKQIDSKEVYAPLLRNRGVTVTAHAEDSEAPFIILNVKGVEVYLEDFAAIVLVKHLQKALDILPSSK
jgi:hypothetical protein